MEFLGKIVNGSKLLTISKKCLVLVVQLGSEYASEYSVTEYVFYSNF